MSDNTMLILIDHREKLPYTFESVHSPVLPFATRTCQLETGDYSARFQGDGYIEPAEAAVVERKTLLDLYTTLGQHRDRFEFEFKRMARYGFAALVIEADWAAIAQPNETLGWPTRLQPKSVIATLIAWSERYRVHLFPCPNRNFAEQLTFRLLERWLRDRAAEGRTRRAQA